MAVAPTDVVGILLAGGYGRRYGSDKRWVAIGGCPMALVAAANLQGQVNRVVAVVRPDDGPLAQRFATAGVAALATPRACEGMGGSLAAGVAAVPEASGWVIALADMPFIRPETIARVSAALRAGDPLVAPRYRGRRGHPVGFGAEFFARLAALTGDRGARDVIAAEAHRLRSVPGEDPGVLQDVDRPDDWDTPSPG